MRKKPVIGILGNRIPNVERLFYGMERDYVSHDYVHAVEVCGGVPVIIPITRDPELMYQFIDRIDGLMLSGGYDINPVLFGDEPHPLLQYTDKDVDDVQLSLLRYALTQHMPILGICRGLQLLAVAAGGTLYQDTSLAVENPLKHFQDAKRWESTHRVSIASESILSGLFGSEVMTNSYHHLCLKDCPESFRVTAMTSDGVPEAIEYKDQDQYIVGVQWHPEMMLVRGYSMRPLFESFIAAAKPRL